MCYSLFFCFSAAEQIWVMMNKAAINICVGLFYVFLHERMCVHHEHEMSMRARRGHLNPKVE